jgi:hypothetical protein
MIRYALHCDHNHDFESWFQNSAAYDKQAKRALITCPVCGSAKVEKAIMAPRLAQKSDSLLDHADATGSKSPAPAPNSAQPAQAPAIQPTGPVAMISPPERELRQKLRELRDHIVKNANYVGTRFPEEARKIHYGETEHRSIYGEASPDEAKELHEEGIEFHPIPILPDDQN